MATVTGLTAARMQEIEDASVVDGEVIGGNLILTKHDGNTIDAGSVIGPAGPVGPPGVGVMPGEIRLWPGEGLPDPATYGHWAWANGDAFDISAYPAAAANISTVWNTAHGQSDPGAGKFRVPDLRGLVTACPDALPLTGTRANRMTRSQAIQVATRTGEEYHRIVISEMPRHSHHAAADGRDGGATGNDAPDHGHGGMTAGADRSLSHAHRFSAAVVTNYNASGNGNAVTGLRAGVTGNQVVTDEAASTPDHQHSFNTGGANVRHAHGINPEGGGATHETVQPTVFVPYIVFLG
jgi:microcystin-dependent protein